METTLFKSKNSKIKSPPLNLPLIYENNELKRFKGYFNGFSILIEDDNEAISTISTYGYFGKGSFSRSNPHLSTEIKIIRERQYLNHQALAQQNIPEEKVIVVPDSDEDINEYFVDLKPQYRIDQSGAKETLNLSLEEAFFLAHSLQCLDIYQNNQLLSTEDLWKIFQETDELFIENFVVYYYYRSRNWVVKSGLKFGGDYLLYKQGPAFYHASYLVIIDSKSKRRCMDMLSMLTLNRVCESAGKELLICELIWPNLDKPNYDDLSKFSISEVVMKRWISNQERMQSSIK